MPARPCAIVALVAACASLAGMLAPSCAEAHLRSGTVAVDYKARVLDPSTSAYTARIFQSDRALGLSINPGHAVELLGYLGEPVFRLDASGLSVNAASPTAVVLRLVKTSERVVASSPHWRLERGRRSVVWPDSRAQGLPPGVDRGGWRVPLIVDGRRTQLEGLLSRYPSPLLWPWVASLAALLAAGALPLVRRRERLAARAATWLGVAAAGASVLIVLAFSFDAYASPGTWIEAFDAIAFLLVGLWLLVRGPHQLRMGAAIGLGLVGVAVGLLDGAVFFHPIVLAVLPATAIRLLITVAIGAGLPAVVLACLELL